MERLAPRPIMLRKDKKMPLFETLERKLHRFVAQHHWRGKSVHTDMRFEMNQHLLGFTMADAVEGAVDTPVLTLKDAKDLEGKDIWKIDWSTGEVKKRNGEIEKIWCLGGFTKLFTHNGLTPICNIKVGDYVLSHTGEEQRVLKTFKRHHRGTIFEIHSKSGIPFFVTPEHELLVCRPSGDRLSRGHPQLRWTKAKDIITEKDYLCFKRPKRHISDMKELVLKDDYGYSKRVAINNNFLRFIGFYIGDGYTQGDQIILCFNAKKELQLANEYQSLISNCLNISRVNLRFQGSCILIQFTDKGLAKWLRDNCGCGAINKHMPDMFMNLPQPKSKHLLKGLIESDGYEDDCASFVSTISNRLAEQVLLLSPSTVKLRSKANPKSNKRIFVCRIPNSTPSQFEGFELHRVMKKTSKYWNENVFNIEVEHDNSYATPFAILHNCERKSKQPKAWLDIEGIVPKGEVGATKEFPGIFNIIDKGTVDHGAIKANFVEMFLYGSKLKGRFIFRLVPRKTSEDGKKLWYWLYWKPDDQLPYVLSNRAIRLLWLPEGYSALPHRLEAMLAPEMHYWTASGMKAQEMRKKAARYLKDRITLSRVGFLLSHRHWKGQFVVRDMPVEDWHLSLDKYLFHLDKSPIDNDVVNALSFSKKGEYFSPGEKRPNTPINPNKEIPAYVDKVDDGSFIITDELPLSLSVSFKGKKLKGRWDINRSSESSNQWIATKIAE